MDAPRTPRALVCADEPGLLHAVRVMLEQNGVEVVATVDKGDQAVFAARATDPDLVILDLALSGALGLRLVGALRAAVPDTAVVVVSPFESLRRAAVGAGALDLVSPRDIRRLAVSVHHVLEAHPDTCECLIGLRDPGSSAPE